MAKDTLKIATWNLDQPNSQGWAPRRTAILEQIRKINADIWILTETDNNAIDLSNGYTLFSCDPSPAGYTEAAIWLKSDLTFGEKISTFDSQFNVGVTVRIPTGNLLVYGTVIPHYFAGLKEGAGCGQLHYKSIEKHGEDWEKIKQKYSSYKLCIAGGFNEALDGGKWYGKPQGFEMLTTEINRHNLDCVTASQRVLDHICVSKNLASVKSVYVWEGTISEVEMSDRKGVSVELYI